MSRKETRVLSTREQWAMMVSMRPDDSIEQHFPRLAPAQRTALKKLGIETIRDLLYHFPARYIDAGTVGSVGMAKDGERMTFLGEIEKTETRISFRSRVPIGQAILRDDTGRVTLVWFHQPYMAKKVAVGDVVRASGMVKKKGGVLSLINPEVEKTPSPPQQYGPLFSPEHLNSGDRFWGIYPESRGITSRWFYHAVRKVLASNIIEIIDDPIPPKILERYHLPRLASALVWIHTPRNAKHAASARKRFAFEEIFMIQLRRQRARLRYEAHPAFKIPYDVERTKAFVEKFGFPLTRAQKRAIHTILSDFTKARPMLRLLEGDVGSGKTAVAATTAAAVAHARPDGQHFGHLQVAYMCPTEILATQHFESFIQFFVGSGIQIGLITGSGCRKFPSKTRPSDWTTVSRAQFLKWVANGEIPIVIGTHALIEQSVKFKHLAYVIIDEQHRFGTTQRARLVQKDGRAPHLLSMSATPIPRTLALTIYGDLDLTLLDEMPHGRKPVITEIVSAPKRPEIYEKIRNELRSGRQAYVICPRIDEPDPTKELALEAKSVKAEAERLKRTVFPEFTIDVLHGKMRPAEKDAVMERFAAGNIDILCATSVVEVGVNVPNATVILIEGADRFGLAQLHQLRGRVVRGSHQAYCYLFSDTKSTKTLERLRALKTARNGFELSEMDLLLRGAGELAGEKQWGISDIGMEAIRNLPMVEAAREEARQLLETDPELTHHPLLAKEMDSKRAIVHFE